MKKKMSRENSRTRNNLMLELADKVFKINMI